MYLFVLSVNDAFEMIFLTFLKVVAICHSKVEVAFKVAVQFERGRYCYRIKATMLPPQLDAT